MQKSTDNVNPFCLHLKYCDSKCTTTVHCLVCSKTNLNCSCVNNKYKVIKSCDHRCVKNYLKEFLCSNY